MRKLLTSSIIAMSFFVSVPTMAKSFGYNSTVSEPLTSAVKIEVVLSEDLSYRANHLPKKLRDRNGSRRLNAGFSNNGFYGEKDLNRLTERLQSKIKSKFEKKGITVSDDASTVLRVTLADAKPNRPTHEQLSRDIGLSFKSFGIGGAEIESELITSGGRSLGSIDYKWYETDIRDSSFGGTWTDAHRAFGRYAKRAAKVLSR